MSRSRPTTAMEKLTLALDKLAGAARPEQVVRARAEALLAYLANVPVAVLVANNRAWYVDANRHAARLTGYSHAELMSMRLSDLTPNAKETVTRRLWKAFLQRGRMSGRYELRRKDGSIVAAHYLAIAHVLPGVHVSALVPIGRRRNAGSRRKKSRTSRR